MNNINNGFSQSASKTLLDVDLSAINKTTSGYTRPLKKLFAAINFNGLIRIARNHWQQ
jgi:hypothetical protein